MIAEAVLIGIAAWRLASLLSDEEGPFEIFVRFRNLIGFKYEDGKLLSWPDTFLADVVSCVWCLTPWLAAVMWGLWQLEPNIVVVIAAMGIALGADRWFGR